MALYGGIVLEEALDLSSDRILNKIRNLHAILLLKITPRFFFFLNKWVFHHFGI